MPDCIINSSRVVQDIVTNHGVPITADTCQFTLYTPNLQAIVGPTALVAVSTGVYQYAIGPGVLNLPGTWSTVWYAQFSTSSIETAFTFTVGNAP